MVKNNKVEQQWNKVMPLIARLYVDEECSRTEIADQVNAASTLNIGEHTIKQKLAKWNIKRYSHDDEVHLAARRLLYARSLGHSVKFKRLDQDFPMEDVEAYLASNPDTQPSSDPLPAYLEAVHLTSNAREELLRARSHNPDESPAYSQPPTISGSEHDNQGVAGESVKRQKRAASSPAQAKRQPLVTHQDESSPDECFCGLNGVIHSGTDEIDIDCKSFEAVKMMGDLKHLSLQSNSMNSETAERVNQLLRQLTTVIFDHGGTRQKIESTDLGTLHWAAQHEDTEFVESLLEQGVEINSRGGLGWTPLHIAAMHGHFDQINLLLQYKTIDVNATDADGVTPLLYAIGGKPSRDFRGIKHPSLGCATLLIRSGADVDVGVLEGKTALHLACATKEMHELVRLISTKTEKLDGQDHLGSTALHQALLHKNEDYVRILMQAGANLNIPDKSGRTPMHVACVLASAELLSEMIEKKVDFTIKNSEDETILHLVCRRDLHAIAAAVAEKPGVDINVRSRNGTTPLIIAATSGELETVQMLVSMGADPTATDATMKTAIIAAIQRKHKKIMKFLLAKSPLEPKNKSTKKWKTQSEHDRRAEQEFSVPVSKSLPMTCLGRQSDSHMVDGHLNQNAGESPQSQLVRNSVSTRRSRENLFTTYPSGHAFPNTVPQMQNPNQELWAMPPGAAPYQIAPAVYPTANFVPYTQNNVAQWDSFGTRLSQANYPQYGWQTDQNGAFHRSFNPDSGQF